MTAIAEDIDAHVREQIADGLRRYAEAELTEAEQVGDAIDVLDEERAKLLAQLDALAERRKPLKAQYDLLQQVAGQMNTLAERTAAGGLVEPVPAVQAVADALPAPQVHPLDPCHHNPPCPHPDLGHDESGECCADGCGCGHANPRTPEAGQRREALRKLTDEAIEAGSYGEPAPEMGFCADCGVPTQQMRHREHCPQDAPDGDLLALAGTLGVVKDDGPPATDYRDPWSDGAYTELVGKPVVVTTTSALRAGGVLADSTGKTLYLDTGGPVPEEIPADSVAHVQAAPPDPNGTVMDPAELAHRTAERVAESDGPRHAEPPKSTDTFGMRIVKGTVGLAEKVGLARRDGQPTGQDGAQA